MNENYYRYIETLKILQILKNSTLRKSLTRTWKANYDGDEVLVEIPTQVIIAGCEKHCKKGDVWVKR
jgi:hypothetical protein